MNREEASQIPIFDVLAHPFPDGRWVHDKYCVENSVEGVLKDMDSANVKWAFAVGLGDRFGGYREATYANYVKQRTERMFPVAYMKPDRKGLDKRMEDLAGLGYVGLKFHPRLGRFCIDEVVVSETIKAAARVGLFTMLCSYCYERSERTNRNGLESVVRLLDRLDEEKLILLHGGSVRLLEYIEVARFHPNVLLDLSMTICKYAGSSVDLDISFAFQQFDRRICIGTDSPEYSAGALRERYLKFTEGIPNEKAENVAFRNVFRFWGREVEVN